MFEKKEIIKTWLAGNCSCTLVIPKDFAKEYGLDKPSHIIIEKVPEGLLDQEIGDLEVFLVIELWFLE